MTTYAEIADSGGARGGKRLSDKSGAGNRMERASQEKHPVKGKMNVCVRATKESSWALTTDCAMVLACVSHRTARRIGFGLCGREKSGTRIPKTTRNNGIRRSMKRRKRLCFTSRYIVSRYQILPFNTSWLDRDPRIEHAFRSNSR